jgi:hypothetical protein
MAYLLKMVDLSMAMLNNQMVIFVNIVINHYLPTFRLINYG